MDMIIITIEAPAMPKFRMTRKNPPREDREALTIVVRTGIIMIVHAPVKIKILKERSSALPIFLNDKENDSPSLVVSP